METIRYTRLFIAWIHRGNDKSVDDKDRASLKSEDLYRRD